MNPARLMTMGSNCNAGDAALRLLGPVTGGGTVTAGPGVGVVGDDGTQAGWALVRNDGTEDATATLRVLCGTADQAPTG